MSLIEITNPEILGTQVKKWARGKNKVESLPDTVGDLQALLPSAGIKGDASIKIIPVFVPPGCIALVIPHASDIDAGEKNSEDNNYSVPNFYEDMFDKKPQKPIADKEDRKKFNTARVGDYTMRNCQ